MRVLFGEFKVKKESLLKVIQSDHLTERTYSLQEDNIYTFKVLPSASKQQIKKAVELVFNVKVVSVNTAVYKPEIKRNARGTGSTKLFKKAMVRLAEGESLDPSTRLVEGE